MISANIQKYEIEQKYRIFVNVFFGYIFCESKLSLLFRNRSNLNLNKNKINFKNPNIGAINLQKMLYIRVNNFSTT